MHTTESTVCVYVGVGIMGRAGSKQDPIERVIHLFREGVRYFKLLLYRQNVKPRCDRPFLEPKGTHIASLMDVRNLLGFMKKDSPQLQDVLRAESVRALGCYS